MANRRMFSMQIVESDDFLDMPISTQLLYFHLGMYADDDGYLNNARKITRMVGASSDDLKVLVAKRFLLLFEDGVILIKHWKINNYIRTDRYKASAYNGAYPVTVKTNGAYTLDTNGIPDGIPSGNQVVTERYTQVRLGKDSIGKDSIEVGKVSTAPDPFRSYRTAMDNDVIIWACNEAERSGKPGNVKYICAILDRFKSQGLTTLDRVQEAERKRKAVRQAPAAHGYQERQYTDEDFEELYFDPLKEV